MGKPKPKPKSKRTDTRQGKVATLPLSAVIGKSKPKSQAAKRPRRAILPRPALPSRPRPALLQRLRPVLPQSARPVLPPPPVTGVQPLVEIMECAIAKPATPEGWDAAMDVARQNVLSPFQKIPVLRKSQEFQVVSELMGDSMVVAEMARVMNADLWRKFTAARKELICSKTSDMGLRANLGSPDKEALQARASVNFNVDPSIRPYSDNMALLWHGTLRGNVHDILSQGLDERLARLGRLGRGIYFTDSPNKAVEFDDHGTLILFAVVLGDCLEVRANSEVREPPKTRKQQRNIHDLFFDSAMGRPTSADNEFVIYNRARCYPMYIVTHNRRKYKSLGTFPNGPKTHCRRALYESARDKIPSFVWEPIGQTFPSQWPFFAATIFGLMNPFREPTPPPIPLHPEGSKEDVAEKIARLSEMGFSDVSNNRKLLSRFGFNLERTVEFLLDQPLQTRSHTTSPAATPPAATPSASRSGSTSAPPPAIASTSAASRRRGKVEEECTICCSKYPPTPSNWKVLPCNHRICCNCYSTLEKNGTTMSGKSIKFLKCPFCGRGRGREIGSCPDGSMTVNNTTLTCEGYEGYGTHLIHYKVTHPKYYLNRVAYVPACPQGDRVLRLLHVAWDRRLCFSIGTSITTGQKDVLVWNIHHKTEITGGGHGFPDPTYLTRVLDELKQYGIQ